MQFTSSILLALLVLATQGVVTASAGQVDGEGRLIMRRATLSIATGAFPVRAWCTVKAGL